MMRNKIKELSQKLVFTRHAKDEMLYEEFGEIYEHEIKEALLNGEIIEEYKDDKPFPSYLILGRTNTNRFLHIVCAPVEKENQLIIITVYQPDPALWIEYKRRIKP